MNKENLTAADYQRIIAARDAAIDLAQKLEDAFGPLIQVHHVGPNGERELCVQFPHLNGELTRTQGIAEIVNQYPLTDAQRSAGWQIVAMTEDAKEFLRAAAKE